MRGLTTRQISEQIEEIYPILFIDAVHFSVRDDNIIRKLAAYVIIGINCDGMKEAIQAAFPKTEYQRCIVHQVRNSLKYVSYKDMKDFASDLKKIYLAPDGAKGKEQLETVTNKWDPKYPNSMMS